MVCSYRAVAAHRCCWQWLCGSGRAGLLAAARGAHPPLGPSALRHARPWRSLVGPVRYGLGDLWCRQRHRSHCVLYLHHGHPGAAPRDAAQEARRGRAALLAAARAHT
eukprot:scaffold62598_cov45-Phaeocystis_antarctica.AAC.4